MIYEVLSRRLKRGKEEGGLPDLIVVDGGRSQLAAAARASVSEGVEDIDLLAIAKGREGEGDRLYLKNRKNPALLKGGDKLLLFIQRLRDEAHRFAVAYHRGKRKKTLLKSSLEDIRGIGKGRAAALLREFGDVESIARAEFSELVRVLKNRTAAAGVRDYFATASGTANRAGPSPVSETENS
jgi:excinuclease ABC subunit C